MNKVETARQLARQTITQERLAENPKQQQGKEQVLNEPDMKERDPNEQVRQEQYQIEQDQNEQTMLQLLYLMQQNSLNAAKMVNNIAQAQEKIWQKISQLELPAAQQKAEWKQLRKVIILTGFFLIIGVTAIFLLLVLSLRMTKMMP